MRKEKLFQTSAMFMAVLLLMLPVSFAQAMNQSVSQPELALDAVVPKFSRTKYIDVQGNTAPDAKLEFYIGPTKVKVSRSRSDGSFMTTRVPLIKKGENNLLVKAIVGDRSVQKSFQVFLDSAPPVLTVSEIPAFTTKSSLVLSGDVSEPVIIKYRSYSKKDDVAPATVTGLEVREVQENQVTLAWTPSAENDLLEYAVYRDGRRVGVSRTAVFIDNSVAGGKDYSYQVSAVDDSCNEGPKSASRKAVTKSRGRNKEQDVSAELSCSVKFSTLDTAVPFDITLELAAGRNIVEIIAEDKAGNMDKIIQEVNLDLGPPQILSTNIDSIGTTYIPEIDVKGKLSEKGTVFVYVNDMSKPAHYALTDDDGNFEIPVKLKQDVKVEAGSAAELDTGVGWENKLRIKAVDLAGQETWYPGASKTATVIWAICGYGSWFDFDIEDVSPSILTPRLLMQGVQQIGIPFTLTYVGGQQDVELAGLVNAVPVRLSPDIAEFYDNDKISVPQVWLQRRADSDVWDGYIQINFAEWPVDQLDLGANKTDAAVEKAISDWRKGEYPEPGWGGRGVYLQPGCIDPALGCVKLYLELDVPLKEKVRIYDAQTQQERFDWKTSRQRNCLPVTIAIDQVIPPDVIRKKSLEATSNFFAQAIELIDKVLDPLTTFTENVMYLCMSSAAAIFLAGLSKRILCSQFILSDGVNPDVAQAGVCSLAYDFDADKKESCERCQWAAKTYKNIVEDLYRPVCDRLTCPSAPTVQKYILDKKNTPKDITAKLPAETKDKVLNEWGVNGRLYSGSGCGLNKFLYAGYTVGTPMVPMLELPPDVIEEERLTRTPEEEQRLLSDESASAQVAASGLGIPLSIDGSSSLMTGAAVYDGVSSAFATGSAVASADDSAGTVVKSEVSGASAAREVCGFDLWTDFGFGGGQVGVKELYQIYKGEGNYAKIKEKCINSSLHPACPLCCGIDYMWEWNSACGIGNFLGTTRAVDLDTFDELKNSVQLAAEKAGKADEYSTPNLMNFLSGFCTSEGNPTPDIVRTGLYFNPKIEEAEENSLQVFVFPDATATGENFRYHVWRGYFAKSFVIESAQKTDKKKYDESDLYRFSSTLVAVKDSDLTRFFSAAGSQEAQKKGFADALCQNVGGSKLEGKTCSKVAADVFDRVRSHVGSADEEYIVKPTSGIINSIRCICFPSLLAYLRQWRAISVAIKNCVDLIRLTGDGSEGQCRSMLSTYVCDLLWEIISCFVNKWSSPGGKRLDAEAGIGSVIGILTGAGSDLANEVEGRYGETATFNAMFNEKEMVHGLCLLAFGLEWNVDASAMIQQSVESVPVETTVLGPTPCQSRFIAWNPLTNPRGLTTWEYHFGIMASAGADITARVKLKCSEGFGCSETDGFVGGECDCNKGGAKEITITPSCKPSWKSQIKKDELVSLDCTYLAQQTKNRYDTLIFEYEWYDSGTKQQVTKSSECSINMVGSAPPSFCRFDPLTASFRCRYGESPSGIQIETIQPEYACTYEKTGTAKTPVFAVDEDPRFELLIRQMMPEEEADMDQGIKFLGYKITNSNGDVVAALDPDKDAFNIQLKTDGQYKQNVEIINDGTWEKFFTSGLSLQSPVTVWAGDAALAGKIRSNPVYFIDDVRLSYTENGRPAVPEKKFVVDIKGNDLRVYEFHGKTDSYLTNSKYLVFEGAVTEGQSYQVVHPAENGRYEVLFKIKSTEFFDDNQVQYLIDFKKTGSSENPCETGIPVTWNVEFTSYDADKYGRITSQVSVDPQTGEKQAKSVPFKITCFEKESLSCKGVSAQPKAEEVLNPAFSSITLGGAPLTEGMTVLPVIQSLRVVPAIDGDVRVSVRKGIRMESRFLPEDFQSVFVDDIFMLTKFEGLTDLIIEIVDKTDSDKVLAREDYALNILPNKIKSVELISEDDYALSIDVPRTVAEGRYQLKVLTSEEAGKVELYLIKPGLEIATIELQNTGENTYSTDLNLGLEGDDLRYYGSTVMFYSKAGQHASDMPNEVISVSKNAPMEAQRAGCEKIRSAVGTGVSFAIPYEQHWPFKDRLDIETTCGVKLPEDVVLEPDSATCDNIRRINKCQEYVARMKPWQRYTEADIEYACGTNLCSTEKTCYYDTDKKDCLPEPADK